jgi:transposase InsO family protein
MLKREKNQVLAPAPLIPELIREAHNSLIGGHAGTFKTSERIREDFFWPSMDRDILAHAKACQTCQRSGDRTKTVAPPLGSLPETRRPSQRVHIDLFGPLKKSSSSSAYVLVVTDAFTKMVNLYALSNKTSTNVAETLYERYLMVFGIPEVIVSDQGKEFCNEFERILWNHLGIEHRVTTPYHPQCNSSA